LIATSSAAAALPARTPAVLFCNGGG
jgi:hypothetical protein